MDPIKKLHRAFSRATPTFKLINSGTTRQITVDFHLKNGEKTEYFQYAYEEKLFSPRNEINFIPTDVRVEESILCWESPACLSGLVKPAREVFPDLPNTNALKEKVHFTQAMLDVQTQHRHEAVKSFTKEFFGEARGEP